MGEIIPRQPDFADALAALRGGLGSAHGDLCAADILVRSGQIVVGGVLDPGDLLVLLGGDFSGNFLVVPASVRRTSNLEPICARSAAGSAGGFFRASCVGELVQVRQGVERILAFSGDESALRFFLQDLGSGVEGERDESVYVRCDRLCLACDPVCE